jgi:hypothetical protein
MDFDASLSNVHLEFMSFLLRVFKLVFMLNHIFLHVVNHDHLLLQGHDYCLQVVDLHIFLCQTFDQLFV